MRRLLSTPSTSTPTTVRSARAAAAEEAGAAEHRRDDGIEVHTDAGARDRAPSARGHDETGQRRGAAAEREGHQLDPPDRQAGQPSRRLVQADHVERAAEDRPAEHKLQHERQHDEEHDGIVHDAEQAPAPENVELRDSRVKRLRLGERQATPHRQSEAVPSVMRKGLAPV